MLPRNKNKSSVRSKKATRPDSEESPVSNNNENVSAAYQQAEEDIEQDADLSIGSPNDDLDEGELARLGGDKTNLV